MMLDPQNLPTVILTKAWGIKPAWAYTSWSVEILAPFLLSSFCRILPPIFTFFLHPFICALPNKKDACRSSYFWKIIDLLGE